MKQKLLTELASKLRKILNDRDMSVKGLADVSGISYTTLNPVLNGTQECGFTKLVKIAEALNLSPEELLGDFYSISRDSSNDSKKLKYYATFITAAKVSYCTLHDLGSNQSANLVLKFPLRCGENPNAFMAQLKQALDNLTEQLKQEINLKEVSVFLSVLQYGRASNRNRIQMLSERLFYGASIQSDAQTDYQTFIGPKNGICISINDGDAISYSVSEGKDIETLHGYGYLISDVAGNYWLGCEAVKHAVRVKEGVDEPSLLSDRLLAAYNDDAYLLATATNEDPLNQYEKASALIKELFHEKKKSYEVVKLSSEKLMENVTVLDEKHNQRFPICLSGELSYLYEGFFPQDRLIKIEDKQSELLSEYGLKLLAEENAAK